LLFKLDQDPAGRGLRCDTGGLFLDGRPLLRRDANDNFEARDEGELRKSFTDIYGDEAEWATLEFMQREANAAYNKADGMKRRYLTVLLFAAGTERRMAGDEEGCRMFMSECAGLTNPLVEYKWYLAKNEVSPS
jgi:hypothetical protein